MRVAVELIAARILGDEVRFTFRTADCPRTGDPDATARAELATLYPSFWLKRAVVHSTSWRYEDEHVVLAYLGYSDEFDVSLLPLAFPLARAEELTRGPASVAAHAIRHLAFLAREEPGEYAKHLRPETLAALERVAPDVSGRLPMRAA